MLRWPIMAAILHFAASHKVSVFELYSSNNTFLYGTINKVL